jgi:glutathione synthase/RimK-type ligase-like ATP-grasp enzyme
MESFGLAIAWNWEFDADFISGIERECRHKNIFTYQITPENIGQVLEELRDRKLSFDVLYDRASDADEAFLPLVKLMSERAARVINPHEKVAHAIDKASMHLECMTHGLHVPYTIILPSYNEQEIVSIDSTILGLLGTPFVVKPANTTGGGTGVVLNAMTPGDIFTARTLHKDDKYLVQEFIHPQEFDGKRGWFRAYSVFGEIILSWWNDQTHMYTELSSEEEVQFDLSELRQIMKTIHTMCGLDFFSSEIARTSDGKFIVVDYVNEICDMRLKSKYHNAVPDAVVHRIERLIANEVGRYLHHIR